MSIRYNISLSAFSIICFPLMYILFLMFLFVLFFYVDVIAFLFLVNRYMLDDLSAKVKVLSDWFIFFMSFFSWFWSCFFTFQNFMFFTSSINSGSKATSSFTGGGILKLHNPYLYWLFFFFFGVLRNCFPSHSFDYDFYFFYKL